MRIAVLEADPTRAVGIEQTLRLSGHHCTRYIHGRSLLQALRGGAFDMLLMDGDAPGISALDVLSWVRRMSSHKIIGKRRLTNHGFTHLFCETRLPLFSKKSENFLLT
ncbi:hypothetical protein AWV80_28710 [Cupriavidus sp. UYMU48A]|nr:hypothetical protein AWV80_28710 [Cupriavidus sp. UYMU48A]